MVVGFVLSGEPRDPDSDSIQTHHVIVQRYRTTYVPLRTRAQNAAFGARSEHMLFGFLCKTESYRVGYRRGVAEVHMLNICEGARLS